MISLTHNDESLYLWHHAPNWAEPVEAEMAVPSRIEAGLSDRESRRRTGESLRVNALAFTCHITSFAPVRKSLRALTTQRVLMPFWPALRSPSEAAALGVSSGLHLTCEMRSGVLDVSTYRLHATITDLGDYTVTADTITVPLLFGHLDPLEPIGLSPVIEQVSVTFREDSAVSEALVIASETFSDGLTTGIGTPKVFPITPNLTTEPKHGGTKLIIDRETIGQGRLQAETYHGATPYETVAMAYTVTDWPRLLRFLSERTDWSPFWLPTSQQITLPTLPVTAGASLAVADAASIAVGDNLALWLNAQATLHKVTAKSGNTLTVSPNVPAFTTEAFVAPALVCRLAKRVWQFSWVNAEIVETQIEFRELPPEALAVAPESTSSLGALPTMATLYTFSEKAPFDETGASVTTWRYTSFERDLTNSENTYTAAQLTNGEITRAIDLSDKTSLTADVRDIVPLQRLIDFRAGTIQCQIHRAAVSGSTASSLTPVFCGDLSRLSIVAHRASVDVGLPRAMSSLAPRHRMTPVCQHRLFDSGCGLARADWTWTAVVTAASGSGVTLNTFARVNAAANPSGFAALKWFAWGFATLPDGQTLAVRASTAISSGSVTLTLRGTPATALEVGDVLTLRPGCDGQQSTCGTKFDNALNYGGAKLAIGNLSLVKVNLPDGGSGGKK